jgi:hypothetical protein
MVNGLEEDSNNKAVELNIISQKCYPTPECLQNMKKMVESVEDETTRNILKLSLCTGFRIVETLNSFCYYDENGRMVVQAPMEKMFRYTKHKSPKRGFWGTNYLNYRVGHDDKLWKNVLWKNPFDLDMDWIHPYISPSALEPVWIFKNKQYHGEYMKLKKAFEEFEVYYFRSRHLFPTKVRYVPSWHFFRKSFVAGLVYKKVFADGFEIVNFLHWGNPSMILQYFKIYREGDMAGANEMIHNMKSFSMGKKGEN